ncbi:MAG: TAXI family TRAP transporter solute-binding subunit [Pseudomonadota bacterium]
MRFIKSKLGQLLLILAVLVLVGGAYVYFDQQRVHTVKVGTSGAGNISFTVSQELAKIMAREYPRLRLEIVETKGAVENMLLLQQGKIDLGFSQNDIPAVPEARMVAFVHPQLFHLIVPMDSSIQNVADLKGKRVGTPAVGGGSYKAFMTLAGHYDLKPEDFSSFKNMGSGALIKAFQGGELDALFGSDAYGEERPRQLLGSGRARLVAIDQASAMRLTLPYITAVTIPKGAYKANPPVPAADLETVAIQASLLAHKDLNPAIVQEITRLLFDFKSEMSQTAPQLAALKSPIDSGSEIMPLHDGARAYFEKDKPSFLEQNPDYIALVLTLATMGVSGLLAMRAKLKNVNKKRADQYNQEIVTLMELVQNSGDIEQLATAERKLFAMFKQVVDDKDHDELDGAALESFILTWNQALQTVRHRQIMLAGASSKDQPLPTTLSPFLPVAGV